MVHYPSSADETNIQDLSKFMIPRIDFDHPSMSPEIARYLRDLVALFIRYFRLNQHEEQAQLIKKGADTIMQCFQLNRDGEYNNEAYLRELQVCLLSMSTC